MAIRESDKTFLAIPVGKIDAATVKSSDNVRRLYRKAALGSSFLAFRVTGDRKSVV